MSEKYHNENRHLYPLRFIPVPAERPWGGNALATRFGKPFDPQKTIGESWEISGFEQDSSVVAEGYLEQNALYDIIETYMGDIVGEEIYKIFGNEFPLLIKLLDIRNKLSVQVHPDDETAFDRHNSYGKSEAWYVLSAEPGARIYMGFNRDMDPNDFYRRCREGRAEEVLNVIEPKAGDFFYIEAGTVHSADAGVVIAEVQQLSDVTYRLYDWGRELDPATRREMHLDLAFDCINYRKYDPEHYFVPASRGAGRLTDNRHFTINLMDLKDTFHIYPDRYESFILYFAVSGAASLTPPQGKPGTETRISAGEWILVPAAYPDFLLRGEEPGTRVLEVYIRLEEEKDSYLDDETEADTKTEQA